MFSARGVTSRVSCWSATSAAMAFHQTPLGILRAQAPTIASTSAPTWVRQVVGSSSEPAMMSITQHGFPITSHMSATAFSFGLRARWAPATSAHATLQHQSRSWGWPVRMHRIACETKKAAASAPVTRRAFSLTSERPPRQELLPEPLDDVVHERRDALVLVERLPDRGDRLLDLGGRDREGRLDLEDVPMLGGRLADD